jgi:hypothetical protein
MIERNKMGRIKKILCITSVSIFWCLIHNYVSLASSELAVELHVREQRGVNRTSAPVSYGVPFAREANLLTTDNLYIEGKQAQFRVLSRYDGPPEDKTRPIRMILVDFQMDINAWEARKLKLVNIPPKPVTQLLPIIFDQSDDLATKTPEGVVIDTGSVTVYISGTAGNLFDRVLTAEGFPVIQHPREDGFHVLFNGVTYSSANVSPDSIIIEENGSLRCVIKVEGQFADAAGNLLIPPPTRTGTIPDTPLRYTVRYEAYKGKRYVKLQVTLRNENKGWTYQESRPVHNIHITQAYLKTTLNHLSQSRQVVFDGYADSFVNGTYGILQREVSDGKKPAYDWHYGITRNGHHVAQGSKYDSFVNIRDSTHGLMVANRWFWQNHPVDVTVSDNELHMNLWPDVRDAIWPPNDGSTHRILGGSWKTHEILYAFHGPAADFDQDLAHIKNRLIARCSDEYYAATDFFPFMAPAEVKATHVFPAGESLQTALTFFNHQHRAKFDSAYIQNRSRYNTVLDMRGGRKVKLSKDPDHYATWYGWLAFGGMPRAPGFGYHNQHYDWSYLALMGFLRFADYSMLEMAEEFLRHKADFLVIHDPEAKKGDGTLRYEYHGGQRYEQDALFSYHDDYGPYSSKPRMASHFWTSGMTLQYLLTGDHFYKDAVSQCYDHVVRVKDIPTMTGAETRNQSRGIDALVNAYILTGNHSYIEWAYDIFVHYLLTKEGGSGDQSSGWIKGGQPDKMSIIFDAWMIEPVIKLHLSLLSADKVEPAGNVKRFIYRWSDWAKNSLWKNKPHGQYRNSKKQYFPYVIHSQWDIDANSFAGVVDAEHSIDYTSLFAYRYLLETGPCKKSWLSLARNIFKDCLYYGKTSRWTATKLTQGSYPHGAEGFSDNPGSGHWKVPKAILGPMFYIKTESIEN